MIRFLKILFSFINVSFIFYFISEYESFMFDFFSSINFILFSFSILFFFAIEIYFVYKKRKLNIKYDVSYIIVQLIILFLILRNLYDTNLFLNFSKMAIYTELPSSINSFFIINNYVYVNILNLCLLGIIFVNKEK
jgi:hypothetical protein